MKKLEATLAQIRKRGLKGKPALMTHVVLGYPTLKESLTVVRAMADSGAEIIELQIPFSDPLADGPTIMHANEVALAHGVTPRDCMRAMDQLSSRVKVPLLFMSYYNILFSYPGRLKRFLQDASNAGAEGLIIPDIPLEEAGDGYWSESVAHGLVPIPIVSPVSDKKRLKKIGAETNGGFIYCISTTGTTGARKSLPANVGSYLRNVRQATGRPLALGFGISKPEQVRAAGEHAEIAIVGSAMIDLIRNGRGALSSRVSRFVSRLIS